jgi:hypothetical protein
MRLLPAAILPALILSTLTLGGCGSLLTEGTADVAGVAGAGVAAGVTKSATAAAAIGLGVQSLASEGLKYAERSVHREEQEAIASAAGPLQPGQVAPWSVSHRIPIESDEHGDLVVSRDFGAGAIACKEVVFSVNTKIHRVTQRAFYITTICREGAAWRWAAAEPTTERWDGLQ